jgi:Predicted hydrolases or acyltransferases (alpha/beta hydrolase superfamily)
MTYERMVADTVELIEHLQQRLGVEKVILVGHSWGSMLGIGVIQERPDLIAAYVGVGQALTWNPAFEETKRLILAAAKEAGDTDVIASLEALPEKWPGASEHDAYMDRIETIQGPLSRYGAGLHAANGGGEKNLSWSSPPCCRPLRQLAR